VESAYAETDGKETLKKSAKKGAGREVHLGRDDDVPAGAYGSIDGEVEAEESESESESNSDLDSVRLCAPRRRAHTHPLCVMMMECRTDTRVMTMTAANPTPARTLSLNRIRRTKTMRTHEPGTRNCSTCSTFTLPQVRPIANEDRKRKR
jgi:hypothetical protein